MKADALKLKQHLLLFTACTMTCGVLAPQIARADEAPSTQHAKAHHGKHHAKKKKTTETTSTTTTTTATTATAGAATTTSTSASGTDNVELQDVRVIYKRNLFAEKDIPSAITVLGANKIQSVGKTMGSIQTLLKLSPSVQAYSQGPGQSAPTLAIRGVKNQELAETVDGIPLTNFLGTTGTYLSGNTGSPVALSEIDTATVYPGVAPPDRSGFGTVGGTIAYTLLKPTDERYAEISGGIASFDTQNLGFTIDTGKWYNDPDAPKTLFVYQQSETKGYVSNTGSHYHNFMMNTIKPFDDGLTQVGLAIIYNQGNGNVETGQTAFPVLKQKWTYNYPLNWGYFQQDDRFLTTILSDKSYINQYLDFKGAMYYTRTAGETSSYAAPWTMNGSYPYAVNDQALYNFYGDLGASVYQYPGFFTYNPTKVFGSAIAGETSEYTQSWENNLGVTPQLNIHLPHNTIAIGGLAAKDSGSGDSFVYGGDDAQYVHTIGYNSFGFGGGEQRTVYMGYADDKIDLFHNKLHIEPGASVDAAYTSVNQVGAIGAKYENYTKVGMPYLGISYDLPYHITPYATFGKGSLFSPLSNYGKGRNPLAGSSTAPSPELVNMYEAGLRYDTSVAAVSGDYFYQQVRDAFSQFQNYLLDQTYYANNGGYIVRGVELSAEVKITPSITLDGNASYNNTDHTESAWQNITLQNDQFGYAFKGTPMSNIPDYMANIGATYSKGPWYANLSAQYTGQQYLTYDILTPEDPTNQLSGATTTDMHWKSAPNWLLNFNGSYKIPVHAYYVQSVTLAFNAQNILNVHYLNYEYQSENALAGVYSILPPYNSGQIGAPRSLELDVTARF